LRDLLRVFGISLIGIVHRQALVADVQSAIYPKKGANEFWTH
jgi:hypothetical protein